jgi:hypothetical protein
MPTDLPPLPPPADLPPPPPPPSGDLLPPPPAMLGDEIRNQARLVVQQVMQLNQIIHEQNEEVLTSTQLTVSLADRTQLRRVSCAVCAVFRRSWNRREGRSIS